MTKPFRGTILNRAHSLARGLIGCWLFNEGTGNKVFDSSGNSSEGDMQNFSDSERWVTASPQGFSPRFDGADNTVALGNPDVLNPTAEVSIIAGIIPDSDPNPSGNGGRVVSKSNGGTGEHWGLTLTSSRELDFRINNSFSLTTDIVPANEFSVVGGTYDGSNKRYYINKLVKTASQTGAISTGNNIRIGRHGTSGTNRQYAGYILFVFVYDIALSSELMESFVTNAYAMFRREFSPAIFGDLGVPPSIVRQVGEMLQVSENILRFQDSVRLIGEPLNVVEGIIRLNNTIKQVGETFRVSENILRVLGAIKQLDETLQLSEGIIKLFGIYKLIDETVNINEGALRFSGIFKQVDEVLNISEIILRVSATIKIINETENITDSILRNLGTVRIINEGLSWVESVIKVLSAGIKKVVNETLQITEDISKIFGIWKVVNETCNFSENVLRNTGIFKLVTESVSWAESIIKAFTKDFFKPQLVNTTVKKVLMNTTIKKVLQWIR